MAESNWKIAASPRERFYLFVLANAEGQKVKGSEGRVFRRFIKAFGLKPIQDASNDGGVNTHMTKDTSKSLFEISAENRDYVKRALIPQERLPSVEGILGDLLDCIEDLKEGVQAEVPADAVAWDASKENWLPDDDERRDLLDDLNELITGFDREQMKVVAAPLGNDGVKELISQIKRMKGIS